MGIEHEIRVTPIDINEGLDGSVDVLLSGEFDLSTAEELRESFVRSDVCSAPRVRVDLTAVSFLDSTTIGLLVAACKRVRSAGGTFSVNCAEGAALGILEMSGLIDYLEVRGAASLSSAAAWVGSSE